MSSAETEIRKLLTTYEQALNTSDAPLAAACYTADGIFMPTTLPTAAGDQMETAYRHVFSAIRLAVVFTIDELVVVGDDVAYALTRSAGEQTLLASGATGAEANREIFIFRRVDSAWKIARYMFNKAS
jgi:uncharacterized protein (TIGR02246 family)